VIVWLASFPRSGNTLLRQVLTGVFGLSSVNEEKADRNRMDWPADKVEQLGLATFEQPWDLFYAQATASDRLHLVKTHRPPRDDQPAIYVVRDGRRALMSYDRYHGSFTQGRRPGLLELVLGLDHYGGWSEHYAAWMDRSGPTLLLRYEELVAPTRETVARLSAFIKTPARVEHWTNPFDELHAMDPRFFRKGQVQWEAEEGWTEAVNQVFFLLHGDLMAQLGYASAEEARAIGDAVAPEFRALIGLSRQWGRERAELQAVCDERMRVIDGLKTACDERLAVIHRLNAELQRP
jgi:hypothetical protein